ncbi:MAG: hypothetical protein A2805_02855 [Candidatus Andersenbacteria bacterium RIFCSPHIGHO2_01_FULL_46_36]|uniref:Resolvase/invertase-type recombinase catalytic domain-containing protein n=1 Tax=Candidatus Andersenbacteria bacterium RIFCSPHIGHO2_12_FULL_45_11 TaxID=1797281 RepID=A0A1G1X2R7_9BACT|nr:MAG: hypothetical protein A2805_02855 [Candidatus Andersenbacteria bacterium RIFCSPHIGHO2_01_FULL_46_36]OGY34316.1 MAG: hypothetical protein A3D99_04595 [Candidatus Andersenbacteria bacterium RIFCSPHIGHO2_12_FULL_45_11]
MLKKSVTYVRVSSKEQEQTGYSPLAQKRLLWTFARDNSFDVVKEFEIAETAKKAGREVFNEMIAYVKEHEIKHIIVEKTDRLYRNWKDYVVIEELIEQHDVLIKWKK